MLSWSFHAAAFQQGPFRVTASPALLRGRLVLTCHQEVENTFWASSVALVIACAALSSQSCFPDSKSRRILLRLPDVPMCRLAVRVP